jgi:hypothetical protein
LNSKINKKNLLIRALIIITALSLISSLFNGSEYVLAKKHKTYHHNKFSQSIGQDQSSNQNLKCEHDENILSSCSNSNFQSQMNTGDNTIDQNWSRHDSNSIIQGIGQDQSSNQNLKCKHDGNILSSCSNSNFQSQMNIGDNIRY